MTSGPEWERVERPLLEYLFSLGWETLVWSERQPDGDDARSSDRDVLLEKRLGSALLKINRGSDGAPWLDEARISAAVAELRSMPAGAKLLEANRLSTELLLGGFTVAGLDGWDGGRDQTVDYIDWDDWEANDFLAVSQFAVATPGRAPNIRPDVTLFVNGIPVVVIEAKPPGHDSGITDAIDQLRRYANQRGSEAAEGAEQLFWTNQFTVATTGERAEAATFSALPEHYLAWKDPFPATIGEVAASLGKSADAVTQQELLTAGMLTPERLLDIVRHFTLFMEVGSGRTVKVVGRYQQYRGVHKALRRLIEGDTRPMDGHVDRRGGIIWHTQGSGKSLTMVFLIRAMRSHPDLRRFKIVLVTDRTELERQLRSTAELAGETVRVARRGAEVRALLGRPGPGVVMAMIQKYRDTAGGEGEGLAPGETFETLNESGSILVMVDEAHRSQATVLHANLMAALPNAARIGFTGTPIIMGEAQEDAGDLRRLPRPLHAGRVRGRRLDGADLLRGPHHRRRRAGRVQDGRPLLPLVPRPHRRPAQDPPAQVRHRRAGARSAGADRSEGQGHPAPLHRHGDARRLQGDGRGHQPRGVPALPPCLDCGPRRVG